MVKKNNVVKNVILVIVVIALMGLIVFFVGRSYGFFRYEKRGETTNVITIKGIRVNIIEDDDALNLLNTEPLYDSDGMQLKAFKFSITNTSSRPLSYTMKVANDTDKQSACLINEGTANEAACPVLTTDNIRFSYKLNSNSWSEADNLGANNDVITTYTINSGETLTYAIRMWIKSDATNDIMNHYFFGQLLIQGTQATQARCDISNPNSVAIWIACANVNKNYTTISEILSDTTTLQTLINNNDANDYLVASTDFATDIVANEDAMTYIGNNDYSADTLLANNTWLNAIANSTYFEKVLNVKVPTMTSSTQPSGQALASSYYSGDANGSYGAWKAFTDDSNGGWYATVSDNSPWIQYKFDSAVAIKKVLFNGLYNASYKQYNNGVWTLKGSNDGNTFNDIESFTITDSVTAPLTIPVDNATKYLYYRLSCASITHKSGYSAILRLNLYGREDVE